MASNKGNSKFCFPYPSISPEAKPKGTFRAMGTKLTVFRKASRLVFGNISPLKKTLHEMTCIRRYNEPVYIVCTERYTDVLIKDVYKAWINTSY